MKMIQDTLNIYLNHQRKQVIFLDNYYPSNLPLASHIPVEEHLAQQFESFIMKDEDLLRLKQRAQTSQAQIRDRS